MTSADDEPQPEAKGWPAVAGTGEDVCPECGGTGQRDGATCPECDGRGRISVKIAGA